MLDSKQEVYIAFSITTAAADKPVLLVVSLPESLINFFPKILFKKLAINQSDSPICMRMRPEFLLL